jgi:hypothetical protein
MRQKKAGGLITLYDFYQGSPHYFEQIAQHLLTQPNSIIKLHCFKHSMGSRQAACHGNGRSDTEPESGG